MADFLDQKQINKVVEIENKKQQARNCISKLKIIYKHVKGHMLINNDLKAPNQIVSYIKEVNSKIKKEDIYYEDFEKLKVSAKRKDWI